MSLFLLLWMPYKIREWYIRNIFINTNIYETLTNRRLPWYEIKEIHVLTNQLIGNFNMPVEEKSDIRAYTFWINDKHYLYWIVLLKLLTPNIYIVFRRRWLWIKITAWSLTVLVLLAVGEGRFIWNLVCWHIRFVYVSFVHQNLVQNGKEDGNKQERWIKRNEVA